MYVICEPLYIWSMYILLFVNMNKESNSEIQNVIIQALIFVYNIIISYFNFKDVRTIFFKRLYLFEAHGLETV